MLAEAIGGVLGPACGGGCIEFEFGILVPVTARALGDELSFVASAISTLAAVPELLIIPPSSCSSF